MVAGTADELHNLLTTDFLLRLRTPNSSNTLDIDALVSGVDGLPPLHYHPLPPPCSTSYSSSGLLRVPRLRSMLPGDTEETGRKHHVDHEYRGE